MIMSATSKKVQEKQHIQDEIDYSLPNEMPTTRHELQDDDERFEVVICGTALTECSCSCILQLRSVNVLHIDDEEFYGRVNASHSLKDLYSRFNKSIPEELKSSENSKWSIDSVPKVVMPEGVDYKLIVAANMLDYFQFQPLVGYVYTNNQVKGLPLNFRNAVTSGMLGILQLKKFVDFLTNVQKYDPAKPSTHFFKETDTALDCLKSYGFTSNEQISWASYAFCLHQDQKELHLPAKESVLRVQRYLRSCMMLKDYTNDTYSPFMYINFGSGEFCEGCARKSSVYGGTYRLKCPLKKILFDDNGKVSGIIFHDGMIENKDIQVEARAIVMDPEMAPKEYCDVVGTIIRKTIISKTPIDSTNGKSCQIIVPPDPKYGKVSVTYLCQLSHINCVCPQGYYIIVISTRKDFLSDSTNTKDLQLAQKLLTNLDIVDTFSFSNPIFKAKPNLEEKGIFISNGCDSSTHFQHQIKNAYEIAGKVKKYLNQKS